MLYVEIHKNKLSQLHYFENEFTFGIFLNYL